MYTPTLALIALSALFTTTLALPQQRCFAGLCYPNIMDPSQDPAYKKWPKPKPKHEDKNHLVHDRAEPAPSAEVASTMADEPGPLILAGVYICEDVAWGGECTHTLSRVGSAPEDCTVIPNSRATSIGPDAGFYCIFFTNAFCSAILSDGSDALGLGYPGSDNLGFSEKGNFNDRLLSYQCFLDDDNLNLDPETGLRKVEDEME